MFFPEEVKQELKVDEGPKNYFYSPCPVRKVRHKSV